MGKNRVVLDTSILITALLSSRGGSFYILSQLKDKYRFLINNYVLEETLEVIEEKLPQKEEIKSHLFSLLGFSKIRILSNPSRSSLKKVSKIINKDDAPVLISAVENANFLLTLDKKDFLNPKVLKFAQKYNLSILTPKEFIHKKD